MKQSDTAVTTIDEYICGFPPDVQAKLSELRAIVRQHAPDATEKIGYGVPTFFLNGNLVHFAAFKSHIGFYPTPTAITRFQKELTRYTGAKGSVQFPLDEPLPRELIAAMVEWRVAENSRKEPKRKRAGRRGS